VMISSWHFTDIRQKLKNADVYVIFHTINKTDSYFIFCLFFMNTNTSEIISSFSSKHEGPQFQGQWVLCAAIMEPTLINELRKPYRKHDDVNSFSDTNSWHRVSNASFLTLM
jgi:hypothetical protein